MTECSLHPQCKEFINAEFKRISKRIDELKENNNLMIDLIKNIEKTNVNVENILEELKSHDDRLKTLESRDGDKWRSVIEKITMLIVGAIVTYILTRVGL